MCPPHCIHSILSWASRVMGGREVYMGEGRGRPTPACTLAQRVGPPGQGRPQDLHAMCIQRGSQFCCQY